MKRSGKQNKLLYGLIGELGITDEAKADMVYQYTGGRTEKSSEMEYLECEELISKLYALRREQYEASRHERQNESTLNGMRRMIFRLMYDSGLLEPTLPNPEKVGVINRFLSTRSNINKTLNELNIDELTRVINQLQAVRRNYAEMEKKKAVLN
jgi:hypothetical protein